EFFTKSVVNKPLTLQAAFAFEGRGDELQRVMRLAARLRPGMALMTARFIDQADKLWRKLLGQQLFHARGAGKIGSGVCQWIVRLTSGAHTQSSDVHGVRIPAQVCRHPRQARRGCAPTRAARTSLRPCRMSATRTPPGAQGP